MVAIIVSIIAYMNKDFAGRVNGMLLTYLPYFIYNVYVKQGNHYYTSNVYEL